MSGVQLRAGFSSEAIRLHLARLALADAKGYITAREDIGDYMADDARNNIDDQVLFDGSAMMQSKSAIARRGKTLRVKGHLGDSYTFNLVQGGVEIGSNMVYAGIHHFGGTTGRGHKTELPARPVLGVGARQERRIGDYLIAEIEAMQ